MRFHLHGVAPFVDTQLEGFGFHGMLHQWELWAVVQAQVVQGDRVVALKVLRRLVFSYVDLDVRKCRFVVEGSDDSQRFPEMFEVRESRSGDHNGDVCDFSAIWDDETGRRWPPPGL